MKKNSILIFLSCIFLISCEFKKEQNSSQSDTKPTSEEFDDVIVLIDEVDNEEERVVLYVEDDLVLSQDLVLEADDVVFETRTSVTTNGYKFIVKSQTIEFNKNTFLAFTSKNTNCGRNGSSAKDISLLSNVIKGEADFDLSGKNAGNHCVTRWPLGAAASTPYSDYRDARGFSGGDAGRVLLNVTSDIESFSYVLSLSKGTGTATTRLWRYPDNRRTAPKGRTGTNTRFCLITTNNEVLCEN